MNIEYKTEGKLTLKNGTPVESAVVKWLMGGTAVTILQGSNSSVTMDKAMLQQLINAGETIADDLQPNMNSLPRAA